MSYRVEYEKIGNISDQKRKNRTSTVAAVLVALLVLGAIAVKTVGLNWVKEVLLPGDPDVTAAALEGMVENLRSGESLLDAIKTFCREIMEHASLP